MITESLNITKKEIIDNDYFGMAIHLRRMKERLHKTDLLNNLFMPIIPALEFELSLIEFENYCLDQPILEIGKFIKDEVRSFNSYV